MTEPYVHASGDGPPAVLVHGTFAGGPQSFAAQAPLAGGHRLLVVDRPARLWARPSPDHRHRDPRWGSVADAGEAMPAVIHSPRSV